MTGKAKLALYGAVLVTVACVLLWQATGGDYYTKFSVIEEVDVTTDDDDPLAAAGFYNDADAKKTVSRDEFRFGLLPTPQGILDKHAVSVASVSGPFWLGAIGVIWYVRRKQQAK